MRAGHYIRIIFSFSASRCKKSAKEHQSNENRFAVVSKHGTTDRRQSAFSLRWPSPGLVVLTNAIHNHPLYLFISLIMGSQRAFRVGVMPDVLSLLEHKRRVFSSFWALVSEVSADDVCFVIRSIWKCENCLVLNRWRIPFHRLLRGIFWD